MDRVLPSEGRGRTFESSRARHVAEGAALDARWRGYYAAANSGGRTTWPGPLAPGVASCATVTRLRPACLDAYSALSARIINSSSVSRHSEASGNSFVTNVDELLAFY